MVELSPLLSLWLKSLQDKALFLGRFLLSSISPLWAEEHHSDVHEKLDLRGLFGAFWALGRNSTSREVSGLRGKGGEGAFAAE
jgi:hypothetical protein